MTQGELTASLEAEGWDIVEDVVEDTEDGYERHKITALMVDGAVIRRSYFRYYLVGGDAHWLNNDPTYGIGDNVMPYLSGWASQDVDHLAYVIERTNLPDTASAFIYEVAGGNATETRIIVYRDSSTTEMTHKPIV